MPRTRSTTTRCAYCPETKKKTKDTMLMRPLFLDGVMDWPPSDLRIQRQVQALHEAIAPYLCIAELGRLAASGENIQAALKSMECLPEEVQAIMSLLQMLLTPNKDECITSPADVTALLMLQMGHLDHEELWILCLDTKNHVQHLNRLYRGSLNSSVVQVTWNISSFRLTFAPSTAFSAPFAQQ